MLSAADVGNTSGLRTHGYIYSYSHPSALILTPGLRAQPQEFLLKWPIQESLRRLVAGGGADASQAVLVRRQAQSLLDAFRVNTVF